jgi:hypothetical protein
MESIIIPSEFDINKMSYGEVKKMENGGKMIYIGYNKQPLVVQTCECYLPFGLTCFDPPDGKQSSYSINMSFANMDVREPLKNLYDMCSKIDEANLQKGFDNAMTWLGQKKQPKSLETIEALYSPMISVARDEKYPSTFKVKLPLNKAGGFSCEIFNQEGQIFDVMKLKDNEGKFKATKGAKCTAIIQCNGIWEAAGKFGMSWKVLQMKLCVKEKLSGFSFRSRPQDAITGEDIDDDAPSSETEAHEDIPPVEKKNAVKDSDEDDDESSEDESDDEEDDAEPVVAKKKKGK